MLEGKTGIQGGVPIINIGAGNPEAVKYGKMWEHDIYRAHSPGEQFVPNFLAIAKPRPGASIIDFGCGTGRASLMLAKAGYKVTAVDFVRNSLDAHVKEFVQNNPDKLQFIKADLEQPIKVAAEYGICTDVMEHIPQIKVGQVFRNILTAAQNVFFAICTIPDSCGRHIGEPLHLTVQEYPWWADQLIKRECIIQHSASANSYVFFYVSAWKTGEELSKHGVVNVTEDIIRGNVEYNIKQGWQEVSPHKTTETECMILGGGPTLNEFEQDIKAKRANGVKLITLNGAYNWCLDRGLTPSAQIVVDAREFNKRFTKPVVDDCRYLISSQCHPAVLDGLPKDRTYLWHNNPKLIKDLIGSEDRAAYCIPGGSSVLLRAIPLMRMLGYKRFYMYGCDSCISDTRHHAYEQKENDAGRVVPVTLAGRVFWCHPWMVSQAHEFIEMITAMKDEIELEIYGDGLLAHILKTGAEIEVEGEQ